MADVALHPVSTLPGEVSDFPEAAECDNHPGAPAVKRVQGETDSFGCEYYDVCAACLAEIRAHNEADRVGVCEWCKSAAKDLRPHRDFEEGTSGRVYRVCGACRSRETERLLADGAYDDYDPFETGEDDE